MADGELRKTFPVKPRLKSTPKNPSSSPESKYWRSFKTQQISGLISAITSIDFSPEPPHDFAATYSASVTIYDSQTFEPKAKISDFTDVAYSATYRSDGKLLAAGGESGLVQVLDLKKRIPLRQLRGHSRSVRLVRYPGLDKLHLFSGGDDALVKYWDVASETELINFQGHKDYVRCGFASPASSDMFATGSYDHTVRLWDVRVSSLSSVLQLNHGKPVEDVIFLPSGGLIATAGGNSVKIWDAIGGGKLVYTMESHNKTVTSLCVGKVRKNGGEQSQQFRLLSVSLDGYMKVFDFSALKLVHSMRYPSPLLSMGFSPDCSSRVIGTSNGALFVGKRKKYPSSGDNDIPGMDKFLGFGSLEEPESRVLKPTYFRYFQRGQNEKPSKGDYLIKRPAKVKLAEHDKLLKKFRHKEALVSALNGNSPQSVVAVMEELVARKKLLGCVSNLDREELELLLRFLQRYSTMPRYSGFLLALCKKVLQLRADDIMAEDVLKGHIRNLKSSVEEEIRTQQSLQEIQDYLIKRPAKVKLAEHDKLLKKFRHKEALVSALNGNSPQSVVAVMEELVARKKLLGCVSNLDREELELLLRFLQRYSTMPRYSGFLLALCKKVLQLRADDIMAEDVLKGHIRNLKSSVEEEIRTQQSLQEIQGIISPLLMITGRR